MNFSAEKEKILTEGEQRKLQFTDLLANKIHAFCIKRAKIDLGKKSISEDEHLQLVNCYSKILNSMEIVITSWNYTTQEQADKFEKFRPIK